MTVSGTRWKDMQYQYNLEESLPDSTLHCWFVSDNTRLDVFSTYIAEGLQFPFPHVLHRIVCSYSPKDTTRYIPLWATVRELFFANFTGSLEQQFTDGLFLEFLYTKLRDPNLGNGERVSWPVFSPFQNVSHWKIIFFEWNYIKIWRIYSKCRSEKTPERVSLTLKGRELTWFLKLLSTLEGSNCIF